jgi:hypothetical protein
MEHIEVKVGQVWEDCDKRMIKRRLAVKQIVGDYAYCQTPYRKSYVRIRLNRFHPNATGYRLIEDAK